VSLKVIGTDTYRSATYDFLLTFHSNHGPISHRFRDKLQFQSKIAKLPSPPRVFYAPADGVPLGIGYQRKGSKTRMMGLPDGQKCLHCALSLAAQCIVIGPVCDWYLQRAGVWVCYHDNSKLHASIFTKLGL